MDEGQRDWTADYGNELIMCFCHLLKSFVVRQLYVFSLISLTSPRAA